MHVGLLGPLEVLDDEGRPVAVSAPKARELLAVLALRAGEVVPADALIEQLWGDAAPADSRNALQVLVRKLRSSLPAMDLLTTQGSGYRLEVPSDDVDTARFERLVRQEAWPEALALWRGPALADFLYAEFAQQPRARLEELRLHALARRIEGDLAAGMADSLVPELESLVAELPLREDLHGQLMLALYRSGRQADALRAFQVARSTLAEELGLEPGPALRELEAAILAHDPQLGGASTTSTRTSLPSPLSTFVGRAEEVENVRSLLDRERIVTLLGPGGAGKTRLAIEAARGAARDVWFVDLAPVDAASVELTAAAALGLDEPSRIEDFLARRHALIVLDNCEHVVAAAAHLAERLAASGERVSVLATSRERLAVAGEHVWPVPPLSDNDASALFAARAVTGAGDDVELVGRICARLDGLPLAVELAAARTRALALDDIVERLDDRFRLLTSGRRTAEPRQPTLRDVVDWSHDLLFADEQVMFRRLSVFAGGFGLDAAERVCTADDVPAEDVVDLITHLVDKSLVVAEPNRRASRYRLLETLAEYGRLRLDAAAESDATRARHLAWIVSLAATAEVELRGRDQEQWAACMAEERHNVRAAIEWALASGRAAEALTVAKSMAYAWYLDGNVREGHALLTAALAQCDDAPADDRCTALSWIGWFGQHGASTMSEAVEHIEAAVEVGRDARSRPFVVACVFSAILGLDRSGPTGSPLLEECADRLAVEPDEWASAMLHWAQGTYARFAGDAEKATRLLRASIEHYEAVGDRWGTVLAAARLGDLSLDLGRYDDANDMMTKAYEAISTTRTRAFQAAALAASLGHVATLQGRVEDADEWHARAVALATEGGFPRAMGQALNSMGLAARRRGDLAESARLHREALAAFAQIGPVMGDALALSALGTLAELSGELDEATSLHLDAFAAASRTNDSRPLAAAIEGLACVEAARGRAVAALTLLGAADTVRRRSGGPLPAAERSDVDRAMDAAAAVLGQDELAAARAAGATASAEILECLARREVPTG